MTTQAVVICYCNWLVIQFPITKRSDESKENANKLKHESDCPLRRLDLLNKNMTNGSQKQKSEINRWQQTNDLLSQWTTIIIHTEGYLASNPKTLWSIVNYNHRWTMLTKFFMIYKRLTGENLPDFTKSLTTIQWVHTMHQNRLKCTE